jgi:ABC-type sugar transport system substrate-binding protein
MLGPRLATFAALRLIAASCAACNSKPPEGDGLITVTLIIKTHTNLSFVALQRGAEEEAPTEGISLMVAAGKKTSLR